MSITAANQIQALRPGTEVSEQESLKLVRSVDFGNWHVIIIYNGVQIASTARAYSSLLRPQTDF